MVLRLAGSPRKTMERKMVMATLSLSMGATLETSPICKALKQKSQESPVAMAERNRKSREWELMLRRLRAVPLARTMPQVRSRMKRTRTAVARLASMSRTPVLEKMAVRAAKKAASRAETFHMAQIPPEPSCRSCHLAGPVTSVMPGQETRLVMRLLTGLGGKRQGLNRNASL